MLEVESCYDSLRLWTPVGVAISSRGSAVVSASATTAEVDREKVGSANSPWRLTVDLPRFVGCRGFSVFGCFA